MGIHTGVWVWKENWIASLHEFLFQYLYLKHLYLFLLKFLDRGQCHWHKFSFLVRLHYFTFLSVSFFCLLITLTLCLFQQNIYIISDNSCLSCNPESDVAGHHNCCICGGREMVVLVVCQTRNHFSSCKKQKTHSV